MSSPNDHLTIIFLVGPSGSGKTFFHHETLAQHPEYKGFMYLSSDSMREVMCGDAGDQSKNGLVFLYLKTFAEYLLKTKQSLILDATNYNRKNRRDFVNLAKKYNARTIYYVFDRDKQTLYTNNNNRPNRTVPTHIIDMQVDGLEKVANEEIISGGFVVTV